MIKKMIKIIQKLMKKRIVMMKIMFKNYKKKCNKIYHNNHLRTKMMNNYNKKI